MAFCDADWGSELDDRKSRSAFVIKLAGAAISWQSKKQSIVALSSTEAEYIALSTVVREIIWLKQLMNELNANGNAAIAVFCDNQSLIKLATSEAYRPRTKHIDIRLSLN